MQRIDENTYIDDTLVTCAEYQLFIDEMREQGKYFQPDHWTSYQFPAGKAREPILGVRHSDAVAFCEWLTERQADEWGYRLPTWAEAKDYIVRHRAQPPFGYWTFSSDLGIKFFWAKKFPIAKQEPTAGGFGNVNRSSEFIFDYEIKKFRKLSHKTNIKNIIDQLKEIPRNDSNEVINGIDISRTTDNILSIHPENDRNMYLLKRELYNAYQTLRMLENSPDFGFMNSQLCAFNRDLMFEVTLSRKVPIDLASNLLIDIFTLQERIAGRSPAFEGIRLVKERTR